VRDVGGVTVLVLKGELDVSTSAELERELDRLGGRDSVVVDLRELQFIDSTGLSVLVRAHQRAVEAGRSFALVPGSGQAQRLLELTGLDERLTIAPGLEELT